MSLLAQLKHVGDDVRIDDNVCIKHPELVNIGNHVSIDWGFYCVTQMELADYVHIAPYCTVIGGTEGHFKMGKFTAMAAGCRIICATDSYEGDSVIIPWVSLEYRNIINKPVFLEDYTTLGTNVVIFPGITIAEGSVVGAGSVVTKNTEPWSIYFGTPAKFIRPRSKKIIDYANEIESKKHELLDTHSC